MSDTVNEFRSEEAVLLAALELDQSKDPMMQVRARALRSLMIPFARFYMEERERAGRDIDKHASLDATVLDCITSMIMTMCSDTSPQQQLEFVAIAIKTTMTNCASIITKDNRKT